jgi:hypothetical protein
MEELDAYFLVLEAGWIRVAMVYPRGEIVDNPRISDD